MKRSRFDVRDTWPIVVLCAVVGMLPLVAGWATYQTAQHLLDIYMERRR